MIRFKTFNYIDKNGIGIEAFRMLIPSNWQFEGGIKWILNNPAMPAVSEFRVQNPKGKEEFEVFPNQAFFWTNNPMVLSIFPTGSRYFGSEILPPMEALVALKKIIIPRFRNTVRELNIVNEEDLPDLVKNLRGETQSQPGVFNNASGAKIRVVFKKDKILMEEEIYCVVESFSFQMPTITGLITNINWIIDYIFSFKAEKGKLDDQSKLFQTIAFSFELNPLWFSKYNQIIEYLARMQIQQIQNIGQLSKIISQTHDEISNMIMDSYYQRQGVYDKISNNFSQYIRGVDEYYNPIENKPVELPSGYDNVWINNLGEYILSDNPNYNPNTESNKNWQKMEKSKIV